MAKNITSDIETQIDADHRRPCILVELYLSSTLRFCTAKTNVTFPSGGNTYTAKHIEVGDFESTIDGQMQEITLKFDNIGNDMSTYVNSYTWEGKEIIIKRIFLDDIDSANDYVEIFHGKLESPRRVSSQWLEISATAGKQLRKVAGKRLYQKTCPWRFGGAECNLDGNSDLESLQASGTALGGSTTTLMDTALTQADDYWNYGSIEITIGGTTYERVVSDFVVGSATVSWEIALPEAVSSSDSYTIKKGCNKTWSTCGGNNAWGPSADNTGNFGGFLHIANDEGWKS